MLLLWWLLRLLLLLVAARLSQRLRSRREMVHPWLDPSLQRLLLLQMPLVRVQRMVEGDSRMTRSLVRVS